MLYITPFQIKAALPVQARKHCAVRKEVVPVIGDVNYSTFNSCTVEVPVGGATVFVTDVVRFEKM